MASKAEYGLRGAALGMACWAVMIGVVLLISWVIWRLLSGTWKFPDKKIDPIKETEIMKSFGDHSIKFIKWSFIGLFGGIFIVGAVFC